MSWQPSTSIFSLRDVIPNDIVDEFITSVYTSEWNYGIPGGFLTNKPNRWTNTYGDGAKIDNSGKLDSSGWPSTFWTAMINKSNVTLETKTESMPDSFCKIVPYLRSLFLHVCPDAKINDNTFNIALSNYYTDPNMKIAGHTDCNVWYPDECSLGPVFASITLYPFDKPTIIDNYWRKVNPDAKYSTKSVSSVPSPQGKTISLIKPSANIPKDEPAVPQGYKCPNCLVIHDKKQNYCPKCGANMQ